MRVIATMLLSVIAGAASAATAWDEALNGDLSSLPNAPSAVTFNSGSNTVLGTVQAPDDARDYFTFTIGPSQQLTQIQLLNYQDVNTGNAGNRGFHALDDGSSSEIPGGGTIGNFLGGDHLDALPTGTDLLAILAGAPLGGTGFSAPLGPGTYTYLVQQTGPPLTGYELNFTVVPLPGALPLFASAVLWIGWRRRSRSLRNRRS